MSFDHYRVPFVLKALLHHIMQASALQHFVSSPKKKAQRASSENFRGILDDDQLEQEARDRDKIVDYIQNKGQAKAKKKKKPRPASASASRQRRLTPRRDFEFEFDMNDSREETPRAGSSVSKSNKKPTSYQQMQQELAQLKKEQQETARAMKRLFQDKRKADEKLKQMASGNQRRDDDSESDSGTDSEPDEDRLKLYSTWSPTQKASTSTSKSKWATRVYRSGKYPANITIF